MRKGHTFYRFGHYRQMPDGRSSLIWTPSVGEIPLGEVIRGSDAEEAIFRGEEWLPNNLADEGEKDILDVYFDDQAVRGSLFGRLYNTTPTDTSTLASISGTEVTGTGYGAVTFTRGTDWSDPALDAGDYRTSSTTKQFSAGGAWSAASHLVLATAATGTSGLLIAYRALSATRTLGAGDTLDVSVNVKLA